MLSLSIVWLIAASQAFSLVSSQYVAFENRHIVGGFLQADARTLLTCRMKCKRTAGCAALDFNFTGRTCWFHPLAKACSNPAFMANTRHIRFVNCRNRINSIANALVARRLTPDKNSHGLGGVRQSGISDAVTCVSRCEDDCVAVDYDESDKSCWFHTERTSCRPLRHKPRCTHYRKKQCEERMSQATTTPVPNSSDVASAGDSSSDSNSSEDEVPFDGAPANVIAKIGNRIENRHVIGGNLVNGVRDWVSCVQACAGTCMAVDFDRRDRSCWHHQGPRACVAPVSFRASCTHYKMNSCNAAGSISAIAAPAPFVPAIQPQPTLRSLGGSGVQCGVPAFPPSGGRIIGGDEARPHSWPWQVALRNRNARSSRCAGTFIHPLWVLTTAHCVDQDLHPGNWLLLSGAHDLLTVEQGRVAHTVESIVIHENFDLNTFDNDIALIKLTMPATWSASRSPICLPTEWSELPGNTHCHITGWGVAANGRRPLKQATLPIVPDRVCRRPDWLGSEFTLTPRMMCAGYEHGGVDTCQGDSGGPFICRLGNRYVQSGLTSFGRGCGLPQKPGVYTKVSHFISWIRGITGLTF